MVNHKGSIRNIELRIAYQGAGFSGWQVQPNRRTVQGELVAALRKLTGQAQIKTIGCSRTDAGVHAHDQRVSFQTDSIIPLANLVRVLNHRLSGDVRILSAEERPANYSARAAARAKHYTYFLAHGLPVSPFIANWLWRYPYPLDHEAMDAACAALVGTRGFGAFQSARDSRVRDSTTIYGARVSRIGRVLAFEVTGRSFLYLMVRNMMGSLGMVGDGRWTIDEFRRRLDTGARQNMWITAPARGLHLFKVFCHDPPYDFCPQSASFHAMLADMIGAESG